MSVFLTQSRTTAKPSKIGFQAGSFCLLVSRAKPMVG